MKLRFGLQQRFIALIITLMTLIFGVMALVLLRHNVESLRSDLLERSKAFTALATKPIGSAYVTYKDSGTILVNEQIADFTSLDSSITNIAVVGLDGVVTYSYDGPSQSITAEQAQSFNPINIYADSGQIKRIIYPYIDEGGMHKYAVVYDISSASIDKAVGTLALAIIGYSLLGLLLSGIVTFIFIDRFFLRPIRRLRDQAMVIAAGQYDSPIPHGRADEIGDLANSVNQMAQNLKMDIQKLKEVDQIKSEFLMIASHNLRTPLSVINGYVEMAKSQALSVELQKMMNSIEANSQRLGVFAEDLLVISNIESGQEIFHKQPIIVDHLLDTIIPEFQNLAEEKNLHFEVKRELTDSEVYGSATHLTSAVWNLLDNALKFTKEDGLIELGLQRVGDAIQITVRDTGIGIPTSEFDKLFTKFHRGTSTMTYNYEGTGIGLYITKLIVEEHQGTITVNSVEGSGSTFTIRLPIAQQ
ncbi:MAG: hypothetical protein JWM37_289 [Candidatus Saccharibacteria bacterium]|nr:hypothetical protein [Candidatus Saccharibacteria bacterium]